MPPITAPTPIPPPPPHPSPLLRLKIQDLSEKGAIRFLQSVPAATILKDAVDTVLTLLYPTTNHWLPVRSITLVIESFGGVAYTTGKRIDDDHKEIHFSTDYIGQLAPSRLTDEITGVIVHEMVHCWQRNGKGSCPGGLIEGIADWVRLKAGYAPPHWKREAKDNWDAGYQTTGYFLEWLEETQGKGAVAKINEALRETTYQEEDFWRGLFGKRVGPLWAEYKQWLNRDVPGDKDEVVRRRGEVVDVEKEDELNMGEDKAI